MWLYEAHEAAATLKGEVLVMLPFRHSGFRRNDKQWASYLISVLCRLK
jgi:hypothetical protein